MHDYWLQLLDTQQPCFYLPHTSEQSPNHKSLEHYVHTRLTTKTYKNDLDTSTLPSHLHIQQGNHLGERMCNIVDDHLNHQKDFVILLGSDCPHLPLDILQKCCALLQHQQTDLVIGPACDGGYYLIAVARSAWPKAKYIFDDIAWGTESVLVQTLQQAHY